jgi:hypothetical protein
MSVQLVDLTNRLRAAVPARNGAPANYAELVKASVWQLSVDLPVRRQVEIAVVPNVDSYVLPADFLSVISFDEMTSVAGTIVGGPKLIATGLTGYQEVTWVEGDRLRISPVPTYSMTRLLWYAAAHVMTDNVYPLLTENGARIALLYGQYLALNEQANASSGEGWMYRIGDETVDKRGQGAAIQAQGQAALASYQQAIRPLKGYGSTGKWEGAGNAV